MRLHIAMLPMLALLGCAGVTKSDVLLHEGDAAPLFRSLGDDGKQYSLEALRGQYVVLYFYPKDDSRGCTMEAKGFRDAWAQFQARGATVLGVSLDSAESHREFREKYGLNFPLLTGGASIAEAYGVPTLFGFARRQTFVLGRDGRILKIFREVDPERHAAEILALLK